MKLIWKGHFSVEIARTPGKSPSTISCDVKRTSSDDGFYRALEADGKDLERIELNRGYKIECEVELFRGLAPYTGAGRLKREYWHRYFIL